MCTCAPSASSLLFSGKDKRLPDPATVLVFRTSLQTQYDLERVREVLNRLTGSPDRWQCDLEDRDKVLRIVDADLSAADIIAVLHNAGYDCAALED
jgi:hypothetical protein